MTGQERLSARPHFSSLVAEFARIQGVVWVCRNSGEFRYVRVFGTVPRRSEMRMSQCVEHGGPITPSSKRFMMIWQDMPKFPVVAADISKR
jgi:hypothetical protein